MKRFPLILGLTFLAVGAGIGQLAWWLVAGLDRQQETNHWVVAGSVFNEIEREVNLFLRREEGRPFGQYNHFYLPPGQVPGSATLARSPLADRPEETWIQGYFQVDEARGLYNNPVVPENPRLLDLARNGFGYDGPAVADGPFDRAANDWLELSAADPPTGAGPGDAAGLAVARVDGGNEDVPAIDQVQSLMGPDHQGPGSAEPDGQTIPYWFAQRQTFQRNAPTDVKGPNFQGDERQTKVIPLNENEAARYGSVDGNRSYEEALVAQNVELQNQLQQRGVNSWSSSQAEAPEPPPKLADPADPADPLVYLEEIADNLVRNDLVGAEARVHPFTAAPIADDRLVLERRVEVGHRRLRQGLVVALPAWLASLDQAIIDRGPLAGKAALAWTWADAPAPDLGADRPYRYRYRHRLPAPFGAVAVHLALPVLEGEAVDGRRFVLLLAVGLLVALGLGLVAVHRMVATRLDFARRRGDFVSAVTHELKTPLTSIRMYGEMLAEDMVSDEARRREYYRTITAEGERLGRLVDNVLELSKLEHGTRAVQLAVGDPREVVEEGLLMLGPHAAGKGFVLDLEPVAAGAPQAIFDRDALLQVVVNLVDNAVKFSAGAAEKVVSLRFEVLDHGIELRIRDRGPGVPESQLRRIFEPFYRGERELTRRTKGTGIGLALARGLLDRMGGALKARNHPDGGFEVCVRLATG